MALVFLKFLFSTRAGSLADTPPAGVTHGQHSDKRTHTKYVPPAADENDYKPMRRKRKRRCTRTTAQTADPCWAFTRLVAAQSSSSTS